MENNFLKYYSKLIADSSGHLTKESIARYLNSFEQLSSKEKDFIEKHLHRCGECIEKYQIIFDEDFEFDDEAIRYDDLNFIKSPDNYYRIIGDEFKITIYKKELGNILVFNSLSDRIKNSRTRILIGDKVLFRLVNAETEVEYYLNQIDLASSNTEKIRLEFLPAVQGKNVLKSFNISNYWYAAAALILVAIGLIYFLPKESVKPVDQNQQIVSDTAAVNNNIVQNDSVKIFTNKNNEELLAYNSTDFVENRMLENFIDRNVRSSSGLKIISPEIGDTIKIPHHFKWQADEGNEYSVVILSNRNDQVSETKSSSNSLQISKEFSPGLYYWKLLSKGKLKAVGKFYTTQHTK